MRPQRFSDFVVDIVKNSPTADGVRTLAESGDTKHPFGVVVTVNVNTPARSLRSTARSKSG